MFVPDLRHSRLAALAALLLAGAAVAQNSSVITLTLPVGGRQLGMGETAVGMPDDVFATYWNPAGLAFGPLADEWEPILSNDDLGGARPTVIVPLKRTSLLAPGDVWLGTSRGLRRFDGRAWRTGQRIGLEQGDVVSDITRRWLGNLWPQDTAGQKELLARVRAANEIERAGEEDDLVDLYLPYDLALSDSVSSIAVDETGTAWIGTSRGLSSYNGKTWRRFDSTALPAPEVSALASGGATTVWVGTRGGLARLRRGELRRFGEKLGLASQTITSLLAIDRGRTVWVGTDSGLSRLTIVTEAGKEKVSWKQFSRADGLVSDSVVSLATDPSGGVWVGHPGGVSHFDGKAWERLVFKDISIRAVSSDKKGNIWIASDKGAWKYFPEQAAKRLTGGKGAGAKVPWAQYHAGNGLGANSALALGSQGDDMWFATDRGIVQLRKASLEVGFMYETLLPSLGLKDLFHTFAGVTVPVDEWGTFGGFINFTSFGENVTYDDETQEIDQTFNSYEAIGALSYGLRLTRNSGLGLNLKLIYSALAPGITQDGQTEDGVAASYAFDVAYLRKNLFLNGLSFGAHLQNIGPAVFYIDRDQTDPIPLTWKFGVAYEALRTPSNVLRVAADYSRETVSRYPGSGKARNFAMGAYYGVAEPWGEGNAPPDAGWADIAEKNLDESIYNLGAEYVYSGVLALRTGLLFDPGGRRQEWDLGAGVTVSDMVQVDGAIIKTIDLIGTTDNSIRNQQLRFSLTLML